MIHNISTAWSATSKTSGLGYRQIFLHQVSNWSKCGEPTKSSTAETDCFRAEVGWEEALASQVYAATPKISKLTPREQTDFVWAAVLAKDILWLSLLVITALGLLLFESHYCFQCLSLLQILYTRKKVSYNYFVRVDSPHDNLPLIWLDIGDTKNRTLERFGSEPEPFTSWR